MKLALGTLLDLSLTFWHEYFAGGAVCFLLYHIMRPSLLEMLRLIIGFGW